MSESVSRRTAIDLIVGFPVAAAAVVAAATPASAKIAPFNVGYVDVAPMEMKSEKKLCATCASYVPGKPGSAKGACKRVSGVIAPGGYCNIWAKKR